jgi:propanol-preferring alcohol dehydrogenase
MRSMLACVVTERGRIVVRQEPRPRPASGNVLIRVEACAVCRTDLHVLDGELPELSYPIIPGHQIVGRITSSADQGADPTPLANGTRVGVPWLGYTCGQCEFCRSGRENLCDQARFTGYTLPGGYAEYVSADPRFCFPVGDAPAVRIAPLLCAGLIGYRALRMCGDARTIGLFGFGAAAHLIAQVIRHEGRAFCAFTRPGDEAAQASARRLGAAWAGGTDAQPPKPLDAAIIFAPAGALVPVSLAAIAKGGVVVCAGIHMSDIPQFRYSLLWSERQIRSVANLTREDGHAFLELARHIRFDSPIHVYPLAEAARALEDLRAGAFTGSAVLEIWTPGATDSPAPTGLGAPVPG